VFIAGSPAVVPDTIERALRGWSSRPTVSRLAGADRYETSALVAGAVEATRGATGCAVIATGRDFPDAMSAAPIAAANGWPILLSNGSALPTATSAALTSFAPTSTLVVGGTSAVPESVTASLPAPTRISGPDRYSTCAAMADYAKTRGMSFAYVAVATGLRYPDALGAAPLIAGQRGVLMLVGTGGLPAPTEAALSANKATVVAVDAVGGSGAVPDALMTRIHGILR
jgi:putative cell wall-binding protein